MRNKFLQYDLFYNYLPRGVLVLQESNIGKILHFSDLHLGNKHVTEDSINWLVNKINQEYSDDLLIVFTGDLFHSKVNVDSEANRLALKLLNFINGMNIPTIIINGTRSHDYDYLDSYNESIFPSIRFVKKKEVVQIRDFSVLCIPEEYFDIPKEEAYPEIFEGSDKFDLLLFHGTLGDVSFYNTEIETRPFKKAPVFITDEFFSVTNIALCGHIHQFQEVRKEPHKYCCYVGSTCAMEHGGDDRNHGINLYSIGTLENGEKTVTNVKRYQNNMSKRFKDLDVYINSDVFKIVDSKREKIFDVNGEKELLSFIEKEYFNNIDNRVDFVKLIIDGESVSSTIYNGIRFIFNEDPRVKVVYKKDKTSNFETLLADEERQKENMREKLEKLDELKSQPSIEDKISWFSKNFLDREISLERVRELLKFNQAQSDVTPKE